MIYDAIIIGAGPSGATAAIYLKRTGLNVLVFYKDKGSLEFAKLKNFYGYLGVSGDNLFDRGLKQLEDLGVKVIKDEVLSCESDYMSKITVSTKDNTYEGKTLLIATGISRAKINKEVQKYLGIGVSTCAFCDGPFYRGKTIYVTGEEPYLTHLKSELSYFSNDLVDVPYEEIKDLTGLERLDGINLKDGRHLEVNNLFLAVPFGSKALSNTLGVMLDQDNNIIVDKDGKTNVDMVYAAGDVTPGVKQVVRASKDGMACALSIIDYLKKKK